MPKNTRSVPARLVGSVASTALASIALASIAVATSPTAAACVTASGGAVVDCDGTNGEIRSGAIMAQGNVAASPGPGAVATQGGSDDSMLNGNVDYDGTQDARTSGAPFYGQQYPVG